MDTFTSNFYSYFKDCYQLDYREFNIDNLMSSKYPFKWFVAKTEDLLDKSLPIIPYPNKKVDELQKDIELYKLEKKLFYASFFVLGKNDNPLFKEKRICSPLLLFPATVVVKDENSFLEIDVDSFLVNRSILEKLDLSSGTTQDSFLSELCEMVMNPNDRFVGLHSLLVKYFPTLDSKELMFFPEVWSETKIKSYLNSESITEGQYKIVPAAGTILLEKSESSLKVLNDLNSLAKKGDLSRCMQDVFTNESFPNKVAEKTYFKNRLNESQHQALQNAHIYSNSVIIGPPGTGKSYTITSIVLDAVVKNKSVLVVSKTKQAVEVLRKMMEEQFDLKNYLIHTSGTNYKVSLKAKIKKYLAGINDRPGISFLGPELFLKYSKQNKQQAKFIKTVQREIRLSHLEAKKRRNFKENLHRFYLKTRFYNREKLWDIFEDLSVLRDEIDHSVKIFGKHKIESNIQRNLTKYRKDLSLFLDALETENFTTYKSTMAQINQENIVKIFPVWLANLSDLNSVLPLQNELFDLVIIDEATQCDIASALPALYRAKHAIVVGDPNQLKHYSFISMAQQRNLREKYALPEDKLFDYRNRSLLDTFLTRMKSQEQISFLREHYRSTPSIIEFSNRNFYENQLEIIKSTPKYTEFNQLEIIHTQGIRNEKGINELEAAEVLKKLDELIMQFQHETKPPSIGILSPFGSQVTYINALLRKKYELPVLKKFDLVCGTPYNFQGSEREIILLSLNVSSDSHHSAFRHVNEPNVMNVAITRAKSFQYVFKSFQKQDIKQDSLLYDYISFIENYNPTEKQKFLTDIFQNEVLEELSTVYDEIKSGYPIAGTILDILVCHQEKNYFIDLIGYPGEFTDAFTSERYATLNRVGIKSLPIHYSIWVKDRNLVLKKIKSFIENP